MALENPPYVLQSASHSAALFRQELQAGLAGSGVVGSGDLAISQNGTPNMSVNVATGQVVIPGTLGTATGFPANANAQTTWGLPSGLTSQGSYYAYQDSTVNLTIAAADPTNPRIDLVVAAVQDAQYSGSNNQPVLQVITGTPAPSPSPPAAPASAVVLAQVAVAAGASSIVTANITDERTRIAPLLPVSAGRGTVIQATSTSNSGQVNSGSTTLTWFSAAAITADGTRRYRITATATLGAFTTAPDNGEVRILDGGSQIQGAQGNMPSTGNGGQVTVVAVWEGVPSAGSHTYAVGVAWVAGSGGIAGVASASAPAVLLVEDIGI